MKRLEGKIAVVTGGAAGIGKATCLRLAEECSGVVVADINAEGGEAVAAQVQRAGGRALSVKTDVSDEQSVREMVAAAVAEFGAIHVLVNNAAIFVLKGIDATVEEWRRILDVNVMGPALVSKHVVPEMKKAGGGAIVNLGSISSFIAQPQFVTYNASKAAVANMTRCMALDVADDNIRVNAVCPGTVWTQIVESRARDDGLDRQSAETHPDYGGSHMIHRIAEPREIANAILFLASDEASLITAECLMVDGGYTAK